MALTDKQARSAKPSDKPYKLADTLGLYLLVKPNGSRIWYLKYRFEGKESRVSFGSYPETSFALVREKRNATKRILKSGLNPSQQRRAEKVIVDESRTFQYIATLWHTDCLKLWSEGHANKILVCLQRYAFPAIGTMDITTIETRHLAQLVKSIDDKGVHDVAGRMRQYLTKIMRHAIQKGVIKYNPAFDLDGVVTPVVTRHHPALPLKRLPELLSNIDGYKGRLLTRLALISPDDRSKNWLSNSIEPPSAIARLIRCCN
ncbi:integrase arm-type DNA-binding domain-containing protein [Salmonella enterica]|nr:integrase arm-type DNA-binding domain-containing protein [Salmonella enterica]